MPRAPEEIPPWLQQIADQRRAYPGLSLREFATLLYRDGISRTKTDKPVNAGTLQRWLEKAGLH